VEPNGKCVLTVVIDYLFIGTCTFVALQFFTDALQRLKQISVTITLQLALNGPVCSFKMIIHPSTDRTHNVTLVIERDHRITWLQSSGAFLQDLNSPIRILSVLKVA
jgi:hypothetical protein